ncbi:Nip100p KNAG_0J01910 [Huiozyma naganishii CBS 8797]|uniref:CAP-Gly domain-containing protein n=1 Tax=Huiozyma naganishii (strain ATCC MYA-139 / BCRC 22969 / CBS 8797 / KCTC 17520 / NBRC 10181 / NCYC 3082 / Yp74L-3) TaxID=1071383 RepID=J7S2W1_HUIN7|nr:hypothetical protein KNAG_0J01910 [Kazachstania naganishii CBS 8797]CCK72272.1 hypothetical protein KNAG_0J01910 [Kazachstania naganishii CBS 8797]
MRRWLGSESIIPNMSVTEGQRVVVGVRQGDVQWVAATVRICGPVRFATGEWVGLELDGPQGRNDGSVGGVRYFSVAPQCGLFVRAADLWVPARSVGANRKLIALLENKIRRMVDSRTQLEHRLVDRDRELERLTMEHTELAQRFDDALAGVSVAPQDLQNRYTLVLAERETLIRENKRLGEAVAAAKSQLHTQQTCIAELSKQLDSQEYRDDIVVHLTETNSQLTTHVQSLQQELSGLEHLSARLESMESKYKSRIADLEDQLDRLQTELSTFKMSQQRAQAEADTLSSQLDSLITRELPDREQQIEVLNSQVALLQEQVSKTAIYHDFFHQYMAGTERIPWRDLSPMLSFIRFKLSQSDQPNTERWLRLTILETVVLHCQSLGSVVGVVTVNDLFNIRLWNEQRWEDLTEGIFNWNNVIQCIDRDPLLKCSAAFMVSIYKYVFQNVLPQILQDTDNNALHERYSQLLDLIEKTLTDVKIRNVEIHAGVAPLIDDLVQCLSVMGQETLPSQFQKLETLLKDLVGNPSVNGTPKEFPPKKELPSPEPVLDTLPSPEQDKHYTEELALKEQLIKELGVKIEIMKGKQARTTKQEQLNIALKTKVQNLTKVQKLQEEQLGELRKSNTILRKDLKLSSLKQYHTIPNGALDNYVLQRDTVDRIDLLSEIKDLKGALKDNLSRIASQRRPNLDWLNDDATPPSKSTKRHVHGLQLGKLSLLANGLESFVDQSGVLNTDGDSCSNRKYIALLERNRRNVKNAIHDAIKC